MSTHSEPMWQAPGVQIYGNVRFAANVSVWPNVVMRAEVEYIQIDAYTNIQDFVMIHVGGGPSVIGAHCSITHHATIHGATIGDNCLIGINATIMDGAVIGENSIVAGNTIVREGSGIPANSIVAGVPGKVVGERNNAMANKLNAFAYHENALAYARGHHRRWSDNDYLEKMMQYKAELEQSQ